MQVLETFLLNGSLYNIALIHRAISYYISSHDLHALKCELQCLAIKPHIRPADILKYIAILTDSLL